MALENVALACDQRASSLELRASSRMPLRMAGQKPLCYILKYLSHKVLAGGEQEEEEDTGQSKQNATKYFVML